VQRVRIRYAKRGRLRFTSHRDFARAFERALRRAAVPMAFSAGFSPHPRISYLGAAPTGVASEAEYLELALAGRVPLDDLAAALDAALPPGLDVLECVEARPGGGGLAERIDAAAWRVELPGVSADALRPAVVAFLARESVPVERPTKDGRRTVDARTAVVSATVRTAAGDAGVTATGTGVAAGGAGLMGGPAEAAAEGPAGVRAGADGATGASAGSTDRDCAILDVVVRQATPAVRPDDVLAALRVVADLVPPVPVRAIRLAQGRLDDNGRLADPLAPDREAAPPTATHAAHREGPPGSGQHQAPSLGTAPAG
jgi:radical SAM-linked protein